MKNGQHKQDFPGDPLAKTFARLRVLLYLVPALLVSCSTSHKPVTDHADNQTEDRKLTYPNTHQGDVVDIYHGKEIPAPYRWLEDPNSEATKAWVEAQNKVTFGYLKRLSQRQGFRQRLEKLWDYERYGLPRKRENRYFYMHNDGLQNQSVLYVTDDLNDEGRVLLDPNTLSDDGTVSLSGWKASDDGKYLAYGLASAGSDWNQWYVLDVDSGKKQEDHLQWVKFSGVSWTADNQGFFYSRYDAPKDGEALTGANYYQKLYYHRLGQSQEKDALIYDRKDEKEWGFGGGVSEDGRYLLIHVWRGTLRKNQIFYKDLQQPDSKVVELITGFDAEYDFLGNEGTTFWFSTDLEAPRQRIIAIDITQPQRNQWKELIPQSDDVLRGVNVVGDRFLAVYLHDAHSLVKVFDLVGQHQRDVELPALGSAGGFSGRREDGETFYSFTNYTTPATIYRFDIKSGTSSVFRRPKVDFDPSRYETKQVFFKSSDGTRVPMFVTHRKDVGLGGDNPTILYGYGGFDIPLTPGFSVSNLVWLEAGGVYAVPNLRGGGEYGRNWHEAGMLDNKQNVFDDFIAAAEWLIDNRYTSSKKLAIRGRSNGGLLVGATMTQRPDLFAAAVPGVGVMDMLRYHKFTIGWAWVSEYGSSDDAEQFKTLLSYSPLHNLKQGTRYPATMVTTADHDDRVVPAHSFKFAASLQAAHHENGPPVIIRIETSAGHGAGTPTSKLIEEAADGLAFIAAALGLEY